MERQESCSKLHHENNKLGNVGVMRYEILHSTLESLQNHLSLIAQLLGSPYSSSSQLQSSSLKH